MKLSTKIISGFAVVITLSAIDSYTNYRLSQKVNLNTSFVANSEAIIRTSSKLHKEIIGMQSDFRGFLLTNDENFLKSYNQGHRVIPRLINEEKELIKKTVSQSIKLDSIVNLHQQWVNYSTSLIKAKKKGFTLSGSDKEYTDLFENKLRRQVGKKLNDEISLKFREFDSYEYSVRKHRRKLLLASIENTHAISFSSIFLTIIIGLISTIYIVRSISKRIDSMVTLAQNISTGTFTIVKDTMNDELSGLSDSLNSMSETLSRNIKELEKRNAESNQFASVVSHDLKAPIRGIHNVITWIEEDMGKDLPDEMRKYLNIIQERIKRMEDLINGLLDYARISREKPLKENVEVATMLEEIVDSLVPTNIKVEIGQMPILHTEKIRLEQVFSNLISNAVKYCSLDACKISVHCREIKGFFEFTISDNGIGIDPKFHDKIFIMFQTLREKDAKESTGIGLAIVKKIIEEQHCTIIVRSELNNGASFIFTWPIK